MEVTPYIMGGKAADVNETPWVVSIHGNGSHICGGFLIDATTLVTAGHCFPRPIRYSVEINRGMPSAEMIDLNLTSVHEEYNHETRNDVAIAKLMKPANISSYATLGTTNATGSLAHVAGWGVETRDGSPTKTLKSLDVSVLDTPKCEQLPTFDPSIMICAAANSTESKHLKTKLLTFSCVRGR
ncbi:Chymotrypsin-like elastase member 2A [Entomophthora muscae]|uniref:Chymotrypsin-like elastase member 2A n=1 Tax=Entomophthora muscae TaxID=34485 RepID=A0ACC2USV3_9FUNG|nr:Chymotrypsin-like elastase member 2A [Entomophthora muscae]